MDTDGWNALAAAEKVLEQVGSDRFEAETQAGMTDRVREALGEAGLFTMAAPTDCGALDVSVPELWRVAERVASFDASVAWILMNSTSIAYAANRLDEPTRLELFRDGEHPYGNALVPVGKAIEIDGGHRLSGRWPFVTGCDHARWHLVNAMVEQPDRDATPPQSRVFIIPADDASIERTWDQASSMRGTGSHAIQVEDVFVPSRFSFSWADAPQFDRTVNRLPRALVFLGQGAAVALGVFGSAIVGARELVGDSVSGAHGERHGDQPRFLQVMASAAARFNALQTGWHTTAEELWDAAVAGDVPLVLSARGYGQAFDLLDSVRSEVSELYSVSTSAAYRTRNPVELALRDSHALSAVVGSFRTLQEDAARVATGAEPRHPAFR